jgi:sulfur-carrier protein
MSISVKFFASIREKTGKAEDAIDSGNISTVADVWSQVTQIERPANLLVAVNQEYVGWDFRPRNGDEVAFFPPVTGG